MKYTANNNEKCWRLHNGVTEPIWSYLDSTDPALGIQITYIDGDWCPAFGTNRKFKIKFKCANDAQSTPDLIQTVYEPIDEGCSYEIQMETYRGCPTECVVYNDKLCSS